MEIISKIIGGCLELVIMLWALSIQLPLAQAVVIIIVSVPTWLKELRERIQYALRYGPRRCMREIQDCLQLYNALRVFNILGNNSIGRSFLPAQAAFVIGLTSGLLFCTIRLYGIFPWLFHAFFPAVAFFILGLIIPGIGGQLGGASLQSMLVRRHFNTVALKLKKALLQRNMKDELKEVLVIRRCLDSLNPIVMQLGTFGSWELTTTADILYQIYQLHTFITRILRPFWTIYPDKRFRVFSYFIGLKTDIRLHLTVINLISYLIMSILARNILTSLGKFPVKSGVQAGSLMIVGDAISQTYLEKKGILEIDLKRSLRFGAIGFLFVGPSLGTWYGFLERTIVMKSAAKQAAAKVAADQLLFAPCFLSAFMAVNGISSLRTKAQILNDIRNDYVDIMINNYKLWPAVQVLNFSIVPLNLRVLFVQTVAIAWNTYLSWMTNREKN